MQFLQKTHHKTHHFVTFFSISPLFVKKVRHFVKKSTFFCHGQPPNPHFQPKIKGALNPPTQKLQLYTQKYIFLVKLFAPFTLFTPFESDFSTTTPISDPKIRVLKLLVCNLYRLSGTQIYTRKRTLFKKNYTEISRKETRTHVFKLYL